MEPLPPGTGDTSASPDPQYRPEDVSNANLQGVGGFVLTVLKNWGYIHLPLPIAFLLAVATAIVKFFFGLYEVRVLEWIEARMNRLGYRYIAAGLFYAPLQAAIFFVAISLMSVTVYEQSWAQIELEARKTFILNFFIGYPLLKLGAKLPWLGKLAKGFVYAHGRRFLNWCRHTSKPATRQLTGDSS
jgi:hypothetical protein